MISAVLPLYQQKLIFHRNVSQICFLMVYFHHLEALKCACDACNLKKILTRKRGYRPSLALIPRFSYGCQLIHSPNPKACAFGLGGHPDHPSIFCIFAHLPLSALQKAGHFLNPKWWVKTCSNKVVPNFFEFSTPKIANKITFGTNFAWEQYS